MTLVRRLCSVVSAIHAASLGKQNSTQPSAQSMSSPVEKSSLNASKIRVSSLWNPVLVLAAQWPFRNLVRRTTRTTAFADYFFLNILRDVANGDVHRPRTMLYSHGSEKGFVKATDYWHKHCTLGKYFLFSPPVVTSVRVRIQTLSISCIRKTSYQRLDLILFDWREVKEEAYAVQLIPVVEGVFHFFSILYHKQAMAFP